MTSRKDDERDAGGTAKAVQDFAGQLEAAKSKVTELIQRAAGEGERNTILEEALETLSASMEELYVSAEELRATNDELMATRAALEAERNRYASLFYFAPEPYLVTDAEGVVREANFGASILLGVREDHLVGKPMVVFVAEASKRNFHQVITRLADPRARAVTDWELTLAPREDEPKRVTVSVAPVRDTSAGPPMLRWLIREVPDSRWGVAGR